MAESVPTLIQSDQIPQIPHENLGFIDDDTIEPSAFFVIPLDSQESAIPKVTGPSDEELMKRMLTETVEKSD
jgi:hypothetical protein